MDPRFKLGGLRSMLENYYICIGEVLDVEQQVSEIVSKTRENLESLFSHFI